VAVRAQHRKARERLVLSESASFAMMAAIASTVCTAPVTIMGAEAIRKSYPQFFEELATLGKQVVYE